MDNKVQGDVEFIACAHLERFEKHSEKFCFLVLSGNDNLPEKVSISRVCFENNYAYSLKEAVGNEKYDILMKGKIRQHKGKFYFNVQGTIELVPTPLWTEKEIESDIDKWFKAER